MFCINFFDMIQRIVFKKLGGMYNTMIVKLSHKAHDDISSNFIHKNVIRSQAHELFQLYQRIFK